jgi:hypothetical protein
MIKFFAVRAKAVSGLNFEEPSPTEVIRW